MAVAGLVALAVLALWLSTAAIALGDVLLLTFAVLVPASLSRWAAGATILVTLVVGEALALTQRHGRPAGRSLATVALGPAMLVGWVVGMVVGLLARVLP